MLFEAKDGFDVKPWPSSSAFVCLLLVVASLFPATVNAGRHLHQRPLPRHERLLPRYDTIETVPMRIENRCGNTIHPGLLTQNGDQPDRSGWELEPGSSVNITVAFDWQGRIWGRTNCSFNQAGTGPSSNAGYQYGRACGTGDCGGILQCRGTGETPVTLAEFTLNAGDGLTYYDISLVDGYNLPMAIVLIPHGNSSLDDIPPNLTNPSCQGTADLLSPQDFNPYSSEGDYFLGTNGTYPLPFEDEVEYEFVEEWCPWDLQVQIPTAPRDQVYQYPDGNVDRGSFGPCYSACAKYNKARDCCTGEHDQPSTCSPSSYSDAAKRVCPDAYSYAFDDQSSTFIIPAGAGFAVVFCPGGRSTDILATNGQELVELAQRGAVSRESKEELKAGN